MPKVISRVRPRYFKLNNTPSVKKQNKTKKQKAHTPFRPTLILDNCILMK